MFKNLLVPTDGSNVSRTAARKAVAIAKAMGARVTGLHVAPSYEFDRYKDLVAPNFVLPGEYEARVQKVAERYLQTLEKAAAAAGVKYTGDYALCDSPAEAIVKAVRTHHCDGIVMGSHGRRGLSAFLLGSETQKVLVAAKVPVVVIPATRA